eukprot:4363718-Pyramimonas_sp.AAC.1
MAIKFSTKSSRSRVLQAKPHDLRLAELQSKEAPPGSARRRRSRRERLLRKRWRALKASRQSDTFAKISTL